MLEALSLLLPTSLAESRQMIHLLGVRWYRVCFFQAGDIFERICDEGGRRLSGTKFYAF